MSQNMDGGQGDSNDTMELYAWKSGWGLPSIDSESLQIMASIKFAKSVPIKIVDCENPGKSPTESIPFFKHKSKILASADEVVSYLREKGYGCDFGLSSKQCAEVVAYTHLINDSLKPALSYFSWIHWDNYKKTTRLCYGQRLPWSWFYKVWYPDRRLRQKAIDFILLTFPEYEYQLETCEPYVTQKASDCIKNLSDKLGTNDYFMVPNKPTSIDALIYSYLAPLLKIPWVNNPLQEVIRATPNLERYIARITHHYFVKTSGGPSDDMNLLASSSSQTYYGSDGHPTTKPPTNSTGEPSSQFAMNQKVFTFIAVAIVMLSYAFRHGMIRLPGQRLQQGGENFYDEDYDEDEEAEF